MELNKAVLDCMQTVRRRLRQELELDIRLSQQDAVGRMLEACLQSSSSELRQLGEQLARLSETEVHAPPAPAVAPAPRIQPDVPAPGPSVRIYRGQRIYA
jgi:hypothetical protein